MTLANFLSAIAQKLAGIWPGRLVYTGEIPQDADGQFFVGIIESGQEKRLDRRRTRTIQFEVLYFLRSKDVMAFQAWAEAMYDNFDALMVREDAEKTRVVHLTGQKPGQMKTPVSINSCLTPTSTPSWRPKMGRLWKIWSKARFIHDARKASKWRHCANFHERAADEQQNAGASPGRCGGCAAGRRSIHKRSGFRSGSGIFEQESVNYAYWWRNLYHTK